MTNVQNLMTSLFEVLKNETTFAFAREAKELEKIYDGSGIIMLRGREIDSNCSNVSLTILPSNDMTNVFELSKNEDTFESGHVGSNWELKFSEKHLTNPKAAAELIYQMFFMVYVTQ